MPYLWVALFKSGSLSIDLNDMVGCHHLIYIEIEIRLKPQVFLLFLLFLLKPQDDKLGTMCMISTVSVLFYYVVMSERAPIDSINPMVSSSNKAVNLYCRTLINLYLFLAFFLSFFHSFIHSLKLTHSTQWLCSTFFFLAVDRFFLSLRFFFGWIKIWRKRCRCQLVRVCCMGHKQTHK